MAFLGLFLHSGVKKKNQNVSDPDSIEAEVVRIQDAGTTPASVGHGHGVPRRTPEQVRLISLFMHTCSFTH